MSFCLFPFFSAFLPTRWAEQQAPGLRRAASSSILPTTSTSYVGPQLACVPHSVFFV